MNSIISLPKSIVTFLSEVKVELTKVTWPKRQEVIKLTTIVLLICGIVGVYAGVVDFGLTKLLEFVVSR